MKILITGAGGQLGRALQTVLTGHELVALTHAQLDITQFDDVREAVATHHADIVINAAPQKGGGRYLFTTVDAPPCPVGVERTDCVSIDVQNTLTHEVGHALGFAHVDVVGSTMEETASSGETHKRVIDEGTAIGFCATYPPRLPALPCDEREQSSGPISDPSDRSPTFGERGCAAAAPAPVTSSFAAWIVALRRRRKARRA